MCGFSGFLYNSDFPFDAEKILTDMGQAILSRGPDSQGIWFDDKVGLSHQRLSIVDLSEAGRQPMVSESGRFVIAFNGEIYNHLEIRNFLEQNHKINWVGSSDTETLLVGVELLGLKEILKVCTGMFAFSLWDTETEQLYLVRDRFGEKPLYYSNQNNVFLFGSELKSFRAHPLFSAVINRNALPLLIRHNYIPAPYSIYENVFKLTPGEILIYKNGCISYEKYWDSNEYFHNTKDTKSVASTEKLESILQTAVKQQMVADVPLGAFLSGGVDSSLIVALMQKQSALPIKTFSIGFENPQFNEAEYAKKVAEHIGTDHTELYLTEDDALNVVNELSNIYDEPFSDSSQIPTYLVSKMAKKHVTVALSGDAGDELFCGYNRYLITSQTWSIISRLPMCIRRVISKILMSIPINYLNHLNYVVPSKFKLNNLGQKLHKAAAVLKANSVSELYRLLISHCDDPERFVLSSVEPKTVITDNGEKPNTGSIIEDMMALDTLTYLPDDILVKVDRAAMANSLETRVPFLDHNVFEVAWRLPFNLKLKGSSTKDCLRNILYKHVPKELIERPKCGFSVPLADWLRGPLRDWADDLLEPSRLKSEGYFNCGEVVKIWEEHKDGKKDWQNLLWSILMFQSWYRKHHS